MQTGEGAAGAGADRGVLCGRYTTDHHGIQGQVVTCLIGHIGHIVQIPCIAQIVQICQKGPSQSYVADLQQIITRYKERWTRSLVPLKGAIIPISRTYSQTLFNSLPSIWPTN